MFIRTGEGPFAMPEKFTFDQAFGQGAAVDRYKGMIGAQALVVNRPGHELFAGTGFAEHKHGRVGRGDFRDEFAHALDLGALAHQPAAAFEVVEPALQGATLIFQFLLFRHAAQQGFELDQLARFCEIVEGAMSQGGHGRLERRFACEHNRFRLGAQLAGAGNHFDAVQPRHVEIDQHAVERIALHGRHGRKPIRANGDLVSHARDLVFHHLL